MLPCGRMQFVLCLILALLPPAVCRADLQRGDDKASLRGLKGVYVVSQFIDAQPEGLTTNGVETLVKTVLRDAKIPVDDQPEETNGNANLSITISTTKDAQLNLYLFTVEVALTQDVQLTRQAHTLPVSARTWSRTTQGLTPPGRTDVIEQALKQCVDQFVTGYQEANVHHALAPPQMLKATPVR